MEENTELLKEITDTLNNLDTGYLRLVGDITSILSTPIEATYSDNGIFTKEFANHFAGLLLVHHALSSEPFTKDKFEHAMVRVLKECDLDARLAPRGNPGHDLTVNDEKWSLKTQADKSLNLKKLHISKFMELGKGVWTNVESLRGLRDKMLGHMESYDRIFSLRFKQIDENKNYYELIEIPKQLLLESQDGTFAMSENSKQSPKPGTCNVYDGDDLKFQLYFDGGTERKLQIKHLQKKYCKTLATWTFSK